MRAPARFAGPQGGSLSCPARASPRNCEDLKHSMSRLDYVASYYAASAHAWPERPALEGTLECDVCVVGGGIAGCSTALHLAQAGLSVVLLEEHRVSWGASGRSGAQALFGVAAGQAKLERLIGAGAARTVWDVTRRGPRAHARAHRPARHRLRLGRRLPAHRGQGASRPRAARRARRTHRTLRLWERALRATRGAGGHARHRALPRRALRQQQRTPAPAQLLPGAGGRGRGRRRAHLRGYPRPALRRRRPRRSAGDHAAWRGAVALPGAVRQRVPGRHGTTAGAQDHGGRDLHRGYRVPGCGACASADRQQCRRQRYELGARLFPPLRRPPSAVRRPRQLLGPEDLRCAGRHACSACWRCSRS